jgi:hypothetical protein
MKNYSFDNGAIYQIWNDRGELRTKQLKHMSDLEANGAIV